MVHLLEKPESSGVNFAECDGRVNVIARESVEAREEARGETRVSLPVDC